MVNIRRVDYIVSLQRSYITEGVTIKLESENGKPESLLQQILNAYNVDILYLIVLYFQDEFYLLPLINIVRVH